MGADFHGRQLPGPGHVVVHKRGRDQLAAAFLIVGLFKERLSQAHGDAAVQLAMHHHWVEDDAVIIDAGVAFHRDDAGLGVHFHLGDMAAVGVIEIIRRPLVHVLFIKAGLHAVGQAVRIMGGLGNLGKGDAAAAGAEDAVGKGDLGRIRLQQVGGDGFALVDG